MKLIAALLVSLLLTGCGGGGGSSPSLAPADAVSARSSSWRTAQATESVTATLAHYSESFTGEDGGTKDDVRANYETLIAAYDILRVDPLSEQHTVSPSGELVISEVDLQYTLRNRTSGAQEVVRFQGLLEWAREEGKWMILRAELQEIV